MFIPLDRDGALPLARQISTYLEEMIRRGHLGGGASLPATRTLARDLQVNRKTVEAAYEELRRRRLVNARAGHAAVVRASIPENPELDLPFRTSRLRDPVAAAKWCAPPEPGADRYDLAGTGPRPWTLSAAALRRHHRAAVEAPGPLFTPPPPLGETALRRAASSHLARCGILRAPETIAVLPDRATALRRLLELYVPRGARVLLDGPGDPALAGALRAHRARATPLGPRGRWGRAAAADPRMIVVTTGETRLPGEVPSLPRRKALLDLARGHGIPVVEDVTGLDRHTDGTTAPLTTLDATGRVLPLCDLGDEVGGGVEAAAVAVTPKAIERLRAAGEREGPAPDRLSQRVLAAALEAPGRSRAIGATRERRELLKGAIRRALQRHLPELDAFTFSAGADAVRLELPEGIGGEALRRAARERGVAVLGARDCGAGPRADTFVLLDLTRHEEGELVAAIRALGAAFDDVEETLHPD